MKNSLGSTTKALLKKYGLKAKKSFGQNFLVRSIYLKKILDVSELKSNDNVLEIGPGLGTLSQELLTRDINLTAVELDRDMYSIIKTEFSAYKNLNLINGDALKYQPTFNTYKLIANIPYNISGRFLRHYLEEVDKKPSKMVLMVQKEVAEKVVADRGKHNLLSLSVQVFGKPKKICNVPANAFIPSPKVDSALLMIDLFENPLIENTKLFFQTIRTAFQAKRKTIKKTLKLEDGLLEKLEIPTNARPQELSIQEWKQMVFVLEDSWHDE